MFGIFHTTNIYICVVCNTYYLELSMLYYNNFKML
jgi:hypothetical protein